MSPKDPKEKRDKHISVWLTAAEYAAVVEMASKDQDPPSTWLRKLALRNRLAQEAR